VKKRKGGFLKMSKTRHINFKLSEADFKKIQAMKNGQSTTQFLIDLIRKAAQNELKESETFLGLMEKLDSSDLSRIADKTDRILDKLGQQNGDSVHEIFKKLEQEIGVLRTVVALIAMGLPVPAKNLERHFPNIHEKLKAALARGEN